MTRFSNAFLSPGRIRPKLGYLFDSSGRNMLCLESPPQVAFPTPFHGFTYGDERSQTRLAVTTRSWGHLSEVDTPSCEIEISALARCVFKSEAADP